MSLTFCKHCGAELLRTEVLNGRCESCGKVIPAGTAAPAAEAEPSWRPESSPGSAPTGPTKMTLGGFLLVVLFITIGVVTGHVATNGSSLGLGLGAGIGSALGVVIAQAAGLWPRPGAKKT